MNKCITTAGCATSSSNPNRTLNIVHEFRQLYENKIRIIDNEGSGDCGLLAKVSLQQDWIRDLNEQNEMLVTAVEELEQEATERVLALEEKLKQSSKHTAEVMNGYKDLSIAFQYVDAMQEDIAVLLDFIKNSYHNQCWNFNGFKLRTVRVDDIEILVNNSNCPPSRKANNATNQNEQMRTELHRKDNDIKALQRQMMAKKEDCHKCEEIKQSMLDMRGALTAEVADKHDVILQLKRDVLVLEEQCRKGDQQTHFKDDIIKELRKEIKGLKAETCGHMNKSTGGHVFTMNQECISLETHCLIQRMRNACDNVHKNFVARPAINMQMPFIIPMPVYMPTQVGCGQGMMTNAYPPCVQQVPCVPQAAPCAQPTPQGTVRCEIMSKMIQTTNTNNAHIQCCVSTRSISVQSTEMSSATLLEEVMIKQDAAIIIKKHDSQIQTFVITQDAACDTRESPGCPLSFKTNVAPSGATPILKSPCSTYADFMTPCQTPNIRTPSIYDDPRFHRRQPCGANAYVRDPGVVKLSQLLEEPYRHFVATKLPRRVKKAKRTKACECKIIPDTRLSKKNVRSVMDDADLLETTGGIRRAPWYITNEDSDYNRRGKKRNKRKNMSSDPYSTDCDLINQFFIPRSYVTRPDDCCGPTEALSCCSNDKKRSNQAFPKDSKRRKDQPLNNVCPAGRNECFSMPADFYNRGRDQYAPPKQNCTKFEGCSDSDSDDSIKSDATYTTVKSMDDKQGNSLIGTQFLKDLEDQIIKNESHTDTTKSCCSDSPECCKDMTLLAVHTKHDNPFEREEKYALKRRNCVLRKTLNEDNATNNNIAAPPFTRLRDPPWRTKFYKEKSPKSSRTDLSSNESPQRVERTQRKRLVKRKERVTKSKASTIVPNKVCQHSCGKKCAKEVEKKVHFSFSPVQHCHIPPELNHRFEAVLKSNTKHKFVSRIPVFCARTVDNQSPHDNSKSTKKYERVFGYARSPYSADNDCAKHKLKSSATRTILKHSPRCDTSSMNEEFAKAQLQTAEVENNELRFAVRNATSELECFEERTAQYLTEKEQLESCCKESLQKVLQLEAEKISQQQLIFDIQADCAKRIACMEQVYKEEHGTCPCRSNVNPPCITKTYSNATCNTEKVSAMDCKECCIDTAVKECQTVCCNISPVSSNDTECDCPGPSSLKAEEDKLEEVVHGLHASVSKMMATESQCKKDKARIMELENQLSIAWRTKDCEVEKARRGREQEIFNLNKLIETLNSNLSAEKKRANSLQKAVDIYCESMDTMKGSEEKFKQEVLDQKTTIKNLQDALIQAKQQLEQMQHKSQSELNEQLDICNNLIELLSETDEKMHVYIRQCEDLSIATQKLIDENTRLEEALFYNHQDLEMYEMRLSKYHGLYNNLEVEHAAMLQELQVLQDQHNNKETFIQTLSDSLGQCREELASVFKVLEIQNIDKDDQTDQYNELQSQLSLVSEKLSHTLCWWEKEKSQNQKLLQALRKSQHATKTIKKEAKLAHDKLQAVALRMARDEQKIQMFSQKVKEYESSIDLLQNEQADLQMRLKEVQDELLAKNLECGNMQKSIKTIQEKYTEETATYKKTITKLTTNVSQLQCECNERAKDLEHTIKKCVECDLNEQKIRQDLIDKETNFNIQLNKFRSEQDRLISVVTRLEEQISRMNRELAEKDGTLERLRNSGQDKLREKHEDNVNLKNEINNLLQSQAILKADNNQLQLQLAQVHKSLIANDEKHKLIINDMESCMNDLQHDKEMLINKHEQILEEVQSLQEICNCKLETITHLEIQLNDMKCVRDALCNESRQVIDHVKSWLQEQRKINMELNHCVKRKNEMIAKHKQEKIDLMEKIKALSEKLCACRCECNYVPPSVKREEYALQVIHSPQGEQSRGVWSMESVDSSPSSLNADSEWEMDYRNVEQYPQTWIHQVQNFTEELQQNNRYWKNKTYNEQNYSPTMVSRDK